jgi:ribosome biogenesis protein YTM1
MAWMETPTDVITSSWDHTIRVWDAETSSLKTELVGNKAFFDISYSPEKRMLLASASERTIRMYDPRSSEGLLVKSAYSSHQVNKSTRAIAT